MNKVLLLILLLLLFKVSKVFVERSNFSAICVAVLRKNNQNMQG